MNHSAASLIYQIAVLLIGTWAVADSAGRHRHGKQAGLDRSLAVAWTTAWLVFQTVSLAILYIAGNGSRLSPLLAWYGAATLLLPFLLASGAHWTRSCRAPLLPLTCNSKLLISRTVRPERPIPHGWASLSRAVLEFLLLAAIPLVLLALLLRAVSWSPDPRLENLLRPGEYPPFADLVMMLWMLASAAILEEVIFRHFLLMRLLDLVGFRREKERAWLHAAVPVLLCTMVWSLGHSAMLQPEWLKYVQIFIYGIALGTAQIRLGVEAAILLHLIYNFAVPYVA